MSALGVVPGGTVAIPAPAAESGVPRTPLWPAAVGLAAFIAAAHLEAAIDAAPSSLWLSAGTATVAVLTGAWAWRMLRARSRWLLATGAAGALLLAGVWAYSRTLGLPGAGFRAPVGPLDAMTALDELLLAVVALMLLGRRAGSAPRRPEKALVLFGYATASLSLMLLSMGCGIGTVSAASAAAGGASGAGGHAFVLFCHLF